MNKVKTLMTEGPKRLGLPEHAERAMSKYFEMIYDYDAKGEGEEFKRLGNTIQDCKDRLAPVFSQVDAAVKRYDGDISAAKEFENLLLLASTPDELEQETVLVESVIFADIMTESESKEIGLAGWWNDGDSA